MATRKKTEPVVAVEYVEEDSWDGTQEDVPEGESPSRDVSEIVFVTELPDSPYAGTRNTRSVRIAAQLRDNPSAWARVGVKSTGSAAHGQVGQIRAGRGAYSPAGQFEAKVVRVKEDVFEVYARYIG